ncbi:hypothetical protein FB567DRAFT_526605 [Paraphoma chrysanthemicola]|uniref:Uncharacterized protein n=1 Tax=Paraphoma chrysanthemicola TaxID=798071 RepID=A0A8K0R7R3_9PLEO|nr:hypothetical protein FB567DRAFT_526605 [Paraphoma chrysanthemicola]
MPPTFTIGKSIISLVNLVTMIGPYLADWNETHIFNPTWPGHARYHNGQTMSMGLFIGLITYYILYIQLPSTHSPALYKSHLMWVLILQTLIYTSSLSGILYPGALWMDPQFGEGKPQFYGFPPILTMAWVGWWVERRRVDGLLSEVKER